MNERFAAVYAKLINPKVSWDEPIKVLRSIGDFSDDLVAAIKEQIEAQNHVALTRLVHTVFLTANNKFTPFLCELLDNYRYDGLLEAIADVLIDIKDERAVLCHTHHSGPIAEDSSRNRTATQKRSKHFSAALQRNGPDSCPGFQPRTSSGASRQ